MNRILEGSETVIIILSIIATMYIYTFPNEIPDTIRPAIVRCIKNKPNERCSFEEIMNNIVASNEIKDLLDEFFGVYIFSFLSQSFAEKLEQEKGTETMSATMSEIKEQIIDDIKTGKNGRSVDSVDWSSEEGRNFIKTEFNRILYILAGNED